MWIFFLFWPVSANFDCQVSHVLLCIGYMWRYSWGGCILPPWSKNVILHTGSPNWPFRSLDFVVNLRTFWHNFTIPNSVVVYHLQISDVPPTNPKALLGRIQKPKSLLIVRRTRTILCFQGGLRAKLRALVHHLSIGARCSSKGLIITTLVNEINKNFAEWNRTLLNFL